MKQVSRLVRKWPVADFRTLASYQIDGRFDKQELNMANTSRSNVTDNNGQIICVVTTKQRSNGTSTTPNHTAYTNLFFQTSASEITGVTEYHPNGKSTLKPR